MKKINVDEARLLIDLTCMPFYDNGEGVVTIDNIEYDEKIHGKDKTAFEALTNHIHFDDYIKHIDAIKDKKLLVDICIIWGVRLKEQYPEKKFRVYLTLDDCKSPTMRFTGVHPEEPVWCEPNDGIMIWTVNC